MIHTFSLIAIFVGFAVLIDAPRVEAQEDNDKQNTKFIDRDGDGICDNFQSEDADSQKRDRHRLRHRERGKSKMRGFGHGNEKK